MSENTERTEFKENLSERNNSRVKAISEEGRCDCCGKSESEIRAAVEKLYCQGKTDEIPKYLFAKHSRPALPYCEEAEIAGADAVKVYKDQGFDDPLDYMVFKYGKKKGTALYVRWCGNGQVGSVWECPFCCGLDDESVFEITRERFKNP